MTRRAKLKCTTHNGKSIFLHTPHLAPDLDRKWQKNMHPMSPVHIVVLRSEGPYRMKPHTAWSLPTQPLHADILWHSTSDNEDV